MLLSFNVQKQIITRTDSESVVCNSMNFLYAQFTFSEEWTGEKTAVFKGREETYNALLDENNTCLVPWEVLTESWFYVSVFCGDLVTANKVTIYTIPSGYEIGDESRVPTPEIYIQVIERLNEIEQEIDPEAIQQIVDTYLADKGFVTEDDVETIVSQYVAEHVHGVPTGGTTGQVLIKSSDANFDAEWGTVEGGGSQVSEMPTPSASNLGEVVQYIGASYGGVIKGHFYECESNGATTPVYSWVDITNEHTIPLHKHTAVSEMYLNATNVWIPESTFIPANINAIVTILPRANKSFVFMLMRKNSETSYTIIEQFSKTADANGTPVSYPVSKSTEDRYIGLYTSDGGITYNNSSTNVNREYLVRAEYSSFVDGTSNSFTQQANTLDFSYELSLVKSVRIGNVYYPVVVDGSGNGDFLTIADAVKGTTDGDIIYICKGIYDEAIDIRNHPRHFIGESKDTTFWVKSSDDYSLPPLNMTGGIVENLTIIAGYGLTPTYEAHRTPYAIHADGSDSKSHELIVRNCNLISNVSAAVGLGVRWNQKMTIQNCYLESNAEKIYSTGLGDFFQQGALYFHNDTNLKESTAFLSVENCEIKGVKNAVAIQASDSGSTLAVRFLDNAMWSADNGTTDAVNIMQTPTGGHLAGSVIDLDAVSFGNNAGVLNATVALPKVPTTDGTYTLQATVTDGAVTYSWV